MSLIAIASLLLAVGTYWGIYSGEKSRQIDADITRYLLTIPGEEWRK